MFGLKGDLWTLQAGFFNGDMDRVGDNDSIDSWIASFVLSPKEGVVVGASYISDLAESGSGLVTDATVYTDSVAGFGSFISLTFGTFNLEAEDVMALDDFSAPVLALGDDLSGKNPSAWVPNEQCQISVQTESAKDFKNDSKRYGAAVSYGLFENTLLSLR